MAKKIIWDKGHGGKDPGIVANGMQEKVLVNQIVWYAMSYMATYYDGFEQRTTREGDTYPSLQNRCDQANNWGADVFISVHINGGGGTGYESYVCNRSDGVTNALQDALNREILAANVPYGKKAHGGQPVRTNSTLHVLNGTRMPAVLTENLYLDSADANTLRNENYLRDIGYAHARGVAAHLGLPKKSGGQTPQQPSNGGNVGKLVVVDFDGLNVRSRPSWDDSAILKTVRKGEAFTIIGEEGDFYKCQYFYITKSTTYVHVK